MSTSTLAYLYPIHPILNEAQFLIERSQGLREKTLLEGYDQRLWMRA
jgi:hypothetical protein